MNIFNFSEEKFSKLIHRSSVRNVVFCISCNKIKSLPCLFWCMVFIFNLLSPERKHLTAYRPSKVLLRWNPDHARCSTFTRFLATVRCGRRHSSLCDTASNQISQFHCCYVVMVTGACLLISCSNTSLYISITLFALHLSRLLSSATSSEASRSHLKSSTSNLCHSFEVMVVHTGGGRLTLIDIRINQWFERSMSRMLTFWILLTARDTRTSFTPPETCVGLITCCVRPKPLKRTVRCIEFGSVGRSSQIWTLWLQRFFYTLEFAWR